MNSRWNRLIIFAAAIMLPSSSFAYIGPGAGLTAIGSALALISAVFLGIVGFIWYPIKRLLRRFRKPVSAVDFQKEDGNRNADDQPATEPGGAKHS